MDCPLETFRAKTFQSCTIGSFSEKAFENVALLECTCISIIPLLCVWVYMEYIDMEIDVFSRYKATLFTLWPRIRAIIQARFYELGKQQTSLGIPLQLSDRIQDFTTGFLAPFHHAILPNGTHFHRELWNILILVHTMNEFLTFSKLFPSHFFSFLCFEEMKKMYWVEYPS